MIFGGDLLKINNSNIDFVELDLGLYEEKDLMGVLFDIIESSAHEMIYISIPRFTALGPGYVDQLASFDEEGVDMILPQNNEGHIFMLGAIYKKSSLVSISNLLVEGETNIEELIYESWAKVVTGRQLGNYGDLLPQESNKAILTACLGTSKQTEGAKERKAIPADSSGKALTLHLLRGDFSICKVAGEEDFPKGLDYCFTAKTDQEFSLVCPTDKVPASALDREDGWKGLRIQGILDFSLVGILAPIANLLANHKIPVFIISSFNTDYIFVKEENYCTSLSLLEEAGWMIN